jgi:hypothetical protein
VYSTFYELKSPKWKQPLNISEFHRLSNFLCQTSGRQTHWSLLYNVQDPKALSQIGSRLLFESAVFRQWRENTLQTMLFLFFSSMTVWSSGEYPFRVWFCRANSVEMGVRYIISLALCWSNKCVFYLLLSKKRCCNGTLCVYLSTVHTYNVFIFFIKE